MFSFIKIRYITEAGEEWLRRLPLQVICLQSSEGNVNLVTLISNKGE